MFDINRTEVKNAYQQIQKDLEFISQRIRVIIKNQKEGH
jgi:hypothetical protein